MPYLLSLRIMPTQWFALFCPPFNDLSALRTQGLLCVLRAHSVRSLCFGFWFQLSGSIFSHVYIEYMGVYTHTHLYPLTPSRYGDDDPVNGGGGRRGELGWGEPQWATVTGHHVSVNSDTTGNTIHALYSYLPYAIYTTKFITLYCTLYTINYILY